MVKRKAIPKDVRAKVLERDDWHCTFPTCTEFLIELHHVKYISQKGPTNVHNLATLCNRHHRQIHLYKDLKAYQDWIAHLKKRISLDIPVKRPPYPRHIDNPVCRDFNDAIRLYRSKKTQTYIPLDEQDSPKDIKRWLIENSELREAYEKAVMARGQRREIIVTGLLDSMAEYLPESINLHRKELNRLYPNKPAFGKYIREHIRQLEDYLWVYRKGGNPNGQLDGILYYWYYYMQRYAFVGYVVSTNHASARKLLGTALIGYLKIEHPECQAVIGEMDDPRFATTSEDRRTAFGRLRLFCSWGGRVFLDTEYMQPKLKPTSKAKPIPLILLYGPLKASLAKKQYFTKGEFGKLLDFVYISLYGDAFMSDKKLYPGYLDYLMDLKNSVLRNTSKRIRLTNDFREIQAALGR